MYRNNRHQDNYRINKRNYGYRQEAQYQQDNSNYRNNYDGHNQHRNTKKQGYGQLHNDKKPDKFSSEYLRNLVQPLKKSEKQKKEDYKIDIAKNQALPIKQSIPRGGKIYLPQYEQQKNKLDQQIQEYNNEVTKPNYLQTENGRKKSTKNRNSDDSDWDIGKQEIKNEQTQQISSLSFSIDIPPLQIKKEVVISPQIKKQVKKEIDEINEDDNADSQDWQLKYVKKEEKPRQQIKNIQIFKVVSKQKQEKSGKTQNLENKEREQKNIKVQSQVKNVRETKFLASIDQQNEDKKVIDYTFTKKKVQYQKQQVKEFVKLIDAIDFESQKQQLDHLRQQQNNEKKSKGNEQKQLEKISKNKELIQTIQQSHKKAKILLTFQAISNIQSFTIKEIQLVQLGLSLKLDSNGKPKLKQSHNITNEQLSKYIKFMKTSHYFPKIGHYQQQAQHFVEIAENRNFIQDQTNRIEFHFCQIKVPDLYSLEKNQKSSNLIGVTIISLLCMFCGSKNQVVVFQNDMSVVCSCKGNDCSEKLYGRISKVKTEIVEQ